MPVATICPQCSRKLRVPDDLLGKKVRCPGCKLVFFAQADAPDVPEPEEGVKSPSRRAAPSRSSEPDERIETEPRSRKSSPPALNREDDEGPDFEEDEGGADFQEDEGEEELPRGRRRHEDDEEGDEDDDGGRPRGRRKAWKEVASGINLVIQSIWLSIGLTFLGAILSNVIMYLMTPSLSSMTVAPVGPGGPSPFGPPPPTGMGPYVASAIGLLAAVGWMGVRVFGHYKCMSVPDKPGTGLRSLAVTTFGLVAAWAVLSAVANLVMTVTGATASPLNPMAAIGGGIAGISVGLLAMLCAFAGFITFVLFLRNVAVAVRRKNLAKTLMMYLWTSIGCAVGGFLLVGVAIAVMGVAVFSAASSNSGPSAGAATGAAAGFMAMVGIGCLSLIVAIGLWVWYIILLFQVKGAVNAFARGR
jgi:hypothetical protein